MMFRKSMYLAVFFIFVGVWGAIGCDPPVNQILCYFDKDCPIHLPVCKSGVCVFGQQTDGGVSTERQNKPCSTGQRQSCYSGPAGTGNKGICRIGEQICIQGKWDTCDNEKLPEAEICDGLDNNCNGIVDEVCQKCVPGAKQACYTGPLGSKGKGHCKGGVRVCLGTEQWGECVGQILPSVEVCDSLDNDCNGQIDEGCPVCQTGQVRACYSGRLGTQGVGVCKAGKQTCTNKRWGACVGQILPSVEVCDKKDNNCNKVVDDACRQCSPGATRRCYPKVSGCVGGKCVGSCKLGINRCTPTGKWGVCEAAVTPKTEICNGKDDNCNGKIDDSAKRVPCANQKGACSGSVQRCVVGKLVACTAADYARQNPKAAWGKPDLCDGIDNNCNGRVDENCVKGCAVGAVRSCYSGHPTTLNKGICRAGKQTCQANKKWGTCVGQVLPVLEKCNKRDDDCDGLTDEAYPEQGRACKTGRPGICANGLYACVAGKIQCKSFYQPRIEICNGKDDNCNGKIDDTTLGVTYYRDADGDNYGDPAKPLKACRRPPGYVGNKRDCYDKNANVFPGQSGFFSNHRGDGSFDYNCDRKSTKRFTKKGDCKKCQSAVIDIGFLNPQSVACGKPGKWVDRCRFDVGKCSPKTKTKYQECH